MMCVSRPPLEVVTGEIGNIDLEVDDGADRAGQDHRDPGSVVAFGMHSQIGLMQPASEPAAPESIGERPAADEYVRDEEPTVVRAFELEVVDIAAQRAVAVAQLTIEEIESSVKDSRGSHGQAPPLVMMINGIVTTATITRMTRYTLASALMKRPLVCSAPM